MMAVPRILLVDGEAATCERLSKELDPWLGPTRIERIDPPEGLEAALEEGQCDLVVLPLPEFPARATAIVSKIHASRPDCLIVLLTQREGEDVLQAVSMAGADGYLLHPETGPSRLVLPLRTRERHGPLHAGQFRIAQPEPPSPEIVRLSDIQYQLLFQSSPIPMWIADRETLAFLAVNEAAVTQYGYTREEFLSMTVRDIRPSHEVPRLLRYGETQWEAVSPLGFGSAGEWLHRSKDGSILEVEVHWSPLVFEGRKASLVLPVDVTERRRSEREVRQSQAQLLRAQKFAHMGSWEWDVIADRVSWSEEMSRILGLPPPSEPVPFQAWLDRVHPDDRAAVRAVLDRALRDGAAFSLEARIVRDDGTVRDLDARGDVAYDEHGRALRMFGIAQDITERKSGQAKLEERARLSALEGAVSTALIRSETLGRILGRCTGLLVRHLDVASARIWVPDPRTEALALAASAGDEPPPGGSESPTVADDRLVGRIAAERRPLVTHRPVEDGEPAFAGYPLVVEEELVGVMALVSRVPFTDGQLDTLGSMAKEIALGIKHKQAEEERLRLLEITDSARRDAETTLARLETMQRVTDAALAHLSLDELVEQLLARVREILAADTSTILLLSRNRATFSVAPERGDRRARRSRRIPVRQDIAGRVVDSRSPLIVEHLAARDTLHRPSQKGTHSMLAVPLLVEGRVIGVLDVGTYGPRKFTPLDSQLLQLVADRVAPTIDRARLFDEVLRRREQLQALSRKLVHLQETERREIARELHDEVGQLLTALKLMVETAHRPVAAGQVVAEEDPKATEMIGIVNDLMVRVRQMSMNLRPAMLDDLGLVPALLWHVSRFSSQTGVQVDLHHAGLDRRFPTEVETAAFRIVQEALTNVARHAGTLEASVGLRAEGRAISLRVEDNGRGFSTKAIAAGESSGLAGMRERARLIGGVLKIRSGPGKGTRILARLPARLEPEGEGDS